MKSTTSKYLWIIDAGHGGLRNGVYTTDPKIGKQWTFEDGLNIKEGVTNRAIATKVISKLDFLGVDLAAVYDAVEDLSLGVRMNMVNSLVAKSAKPTVFVSIHSNAGHGRGFEVFSSPGQDKSDLVASVFCDEVLKSFPNYPLRSDLVDKDKDKEARFYVILPERNKATAKILLENLFFDTRDEAEFLLSEKGQQDIADYICRAIIQIENNIAL